VHAHLHLKLIVTPFLVELFRRAAYRTCHRKELMETTKQYPNALPMDCNLCTKSELSSLFPFSTPGTESRLIGLPIQDLPLTKSAPAA